MLRKDIVIPSGAMALALCVFSAQADDLKASYVKVYLATG